MRVVFNVRMVRIIERGGAVLAVWLAGGGFLSRGGGLGVAREIVQIGEGGAEDVVGGARKGA